MEAPNQMLIVLALMLINSASNAEVAAAKYIPASLGDGERSLGETIVFPETDDDVHVRLLCDASLSSRGRMYTTYCFSPDGENRRFVKAIYAGTQRAVFLPAQVDGKRVHVWFQYAVEFIKRGGQETIRAYPHHFLDKETYGVGYSGPQRYRAVAKWRGCRVGVHVWVTMTVDEHGVASDVNHLGDEETGRCHRMVMRVASSARYIPAFHENKPVTGKYVELFFTRD